MCYGSFVTKCDKPYSDLDFFIIPKTAEGYAMSSQFILDGIGYDFWPVSREFAERLAGFTHPFVSLIADGLLVYAADMLRRELRVMLGGLYGDNGFPELLGSTPEKPQDFDELAALGHRQEASLVALLREKRIATREYASIEALRAALSRA